MARLEPIINKCPNCNKGMIKMESHFNKENGVGTFTFYKCNSCGKAMNTKQIGGLFHSLNNGD